VIQRQRPRILGDKVRNLPAVFRCAVPGIVGATGGYGEFVEQLGKALVARISKHEHRSSIQ
jgi:hypothetical protein